MFFTQHHFPGGPSNDDDIVEVNEHRARILLTAYLNALRTCFAEAELERVIGGRAYVNVEGGLGGGERKREREREKGKGRNMCIYVYRVSSIHKSS